MPPGTVVPYGGTTEPPGWMWADGREVSRTTYPELFAAIGTTYGTPSSATVFRVPNLKGRFPLGKADSGTGSTLGLPGGTSTHDHQVNGHDHAVPTHTHTLASHTHSTPAHPHSIATHSHATPNHQHTSASHNHPLPAHYHGTGTLSIGSSGSHDHPPREGNYFVSFENAWGGLGQIRGALSSGGDSYRMAPASLHGLTGTSSHSHDNGSFGGLVGATGSGNNGDTPLSSGNGGALPTALGEGGGTTSPSGVLHTASGEGGGTSGPSNTLTTNENSAASTSTAAPGTDSKNHLPPYQVMNYLIRYGTPL